MAVNDLIILRKGTATQWSSANPVLASGEPGFDLTNNLLKIGDGTKTWSQLSSINGSGGGGGGSGATELYSYASVSGFPQSGLSPAIYLSTDSGRTYQWNGSSYSEIGPIGGGDTTLWNLLLPGSPTNISGLTDSGQVTLSWAAPSFIGVPLIDYTIQYSSNSGTSWTTFSDEVSTSASSTVTGLNNGTSYIFRVAAVNGIGTGTYSTNSSSFIPGGDPYFSNVSLLLLLNGDNNSTTFTDSSSIGHTVTRTNAIISTTQSKFDGSSMYLNGSSYLSIPSHTSLNMGTGDFTIEFWAYGTDQTTFYPGYISSQGGWNAGAYGIRFDNNGAAQKWGFWKNPADPLMTSSSTYAFNVWRHIALVRQGTTWRMYVDGTQACSSTTQGTDSFDLAYGGTMRIGFGTWDGGNGYVTDYIDCLRITKSICRYPDGTTFSPSTTPFPSY